MQVGFNLPLSGLLISPEAMTQLALEGETSGFDYIAISDHVVEPVDIHARYPYSETGEFPKGSRGERHEQLTTIAYLAAKTSRIRFLTSVMVVPHRPAILAAKMLSTIDVLSGGRLTVGVGAGWLKEEFEALGAPEFAERGSATDEYLQAFRELWTQSAPEHQGRFVRFANIIFSPKPVQKPQPPIWIGGESSPAMRRAARLGDGWYPIGTNPQHPLNTLSRYQTATVRLRRLIDDAGRDASQVALAYRVHRHGLLVPAKADNGERHLFSGSADEIVGDLQAIRTLGVEAVDFNFTGSTLGDVVAAMRQFRDTVLVKVR